MKPPYLGNRGVRMIIVNNVYVQNTECMVDIWFTLRELTPLRIPNGNPYVSHIRWSQLTKYITQIQYYNIKQIKNELIIKETKQLASWSKWISNLKL